MGELDWRAWTPKLAKYYEALLRAQTGAGSSHLHDLRRALRYGLTADLASFGQDEHAILQETRLHLRLEAEPSTEAEEKEVGLPEPEDEESEEAESEDIDESGPLQGPDPQAAAALRRIARKQRNDPYNRETLLGFPLIGVRIGRQRICGPLLVWEMGIEYDPRSREVVLERRNSTPDLNTILLGKLADDPDDISLANEELLPLLYQEDFGPAKIPDVMKVLTGIFTCLADHEDFAADDYTLREFLQQVGALSGTDIAVTTMRPILTNGPRSHAFLLSDLAEISEQSSPGGDSVLAQVVGDVPEEGAPDFDPIPLPFDDTADGGDPLWFPFPSNRAQRDVAQTASRVSVLTVQGPPGTGKSQTIANLVCHLVTEGHSVLVTSHQRKAMEVLSKMLSGFEGLALSMLSGDQESLQRLRTQLEGLQDQPPGHVTPGSIERGLAALQQNDRELRRLARRFTELKRIEHDQFAGFSKYEDLREFDHLSPQDEPVEEQVSRTAERLEEWAGHFHTLSAAKSTFEAVFHPEGNQTSRVREREVAHKLSSLIESARSLDTPVSEAGRKVADRLGSEGNGAGPAVITRLETWLTTDGAELERNFRDLGQDPADPATLAAWTELVHSTGRERLAQWRTYVQRQESFFTTSTLRGSEYDWDLLDSDTHRIRRNVTLLAQRGGSLVWWFMSPDAYRIRRALRSYGLQIRRGTRAADLSEAGRALKWVETYAEAEPRIEEMVRRLPLKSVGPLRPRSKGAILRANRVLSTALQLVEEVEAIPREDLDRAFGPDQSLPRLGTERGRDSLSTDLSEARRWIVRSGLTSALLDALALPSAWQERVALVADGIQEGALSNEAEGALSHLERLLEYYPYYRRMVDLETVELSGLPHTLESIRTTVLESGSPPAWVQHAEKAMEAHRLSSLLRGSLKAHPDNLEEISEALRAGQTKRRGTLSEVIRRKRELGTYKAFQIPAHRVPLLALRKLLQKKRLNNSLLALRTTIDYEAVLKVFPCWICTIDDAARLFPPTAGLFDYLIVDEASQCSQATSMPLAFRARRMIVVGDKKQLQPASSLFLSEKQVRLLQAQHGIDQHPKAPFLDGKESLLGLAEACSNASQFLNEHFRCDPAIIRWSNNRFYDNRLQILTRRRPDRARLPLEVREIENADEDRDTKTNAQEAKAVVKEVRRLISSEEARGKTLGVISPFRPQAELIQVLLAKEFHTDPELIKQHQIVASTADGFQGDERDIILYSFRHGPSSHAGAIATIQRSEERLNVAFTRAKERGVCFVSVPVHLFPNGAIRDFLEHAQGEQNRAEKWETEGEWEDQFDSQFEEAVCGRLRDRNLRVTTQVPCGRYRIDLVVEDSEGRQLAVECDGEWKMDELGQLRPEDYQRQDIIERAGWAVHRISGRRWLLNPEREVELVLDALARQPTRAVWQTLSGSASGSELVEREILGEPSVSQAPATAPAEVGTEEVAGVGAETNEAHHPAADAAPRASAHRDDIEAERVRRLCRWIILRPQVEWSVVDGLEEILELRRKGSPLMPAQEGFLREALEWAVNLGFDPDVDEDD